jgi:hypothetical protein
MAEMKSNAKKVPASAPSLKSRGMKLKGKKPVPGEPKPKDLKVSKKLEEAFGGKDKP